MIYTNNCKLYNIKSVIIIKMALKLIMHILPSRYVMCYVIMRYIHNTYMIFHSCYYVQLNCLYKIASTCSL